MFGFCIVFFIIIIKILNESLQPGIFSSIYLAYPGARKNLVDKVSSSFQIKLAQFFFW